MYNERAGGARAAGSVTFLVVVDVRKQEFDLTPFVVLLNSLLFINNFQNSSIIPAYTTTNTTTSNQKLEVLGSKENLETFKS